MLVLVTMKDVLLTMAYRKKKKKTTLKTLDLEVTKAIIKEIIQVERQVPRVEA